MDLEYEEIFSLNGYDSNNTPFTAKNICEGQDDKPEPQPQPDPEPEPIPDKYKFSATMYGCTCMVNDEAFYSGEVIEVEKDVAMTVVIRPDRMTDTFLSFMVNGQEKKDELSDDTYTFTMEENVNVVAICVDSDMYHNTLTLKYGGMDEIKVNEENVEVDSPAIYYYPLDATQMIRIEWTPMPDYILKTFKVNGKEVTVEEGEYSYEFEMREDSVVELVYWDAVEVSLNYDITKTEVILKDREGKKIDITANPFYVQRNEEIEVIVEPFEGFVFEKMVMTIGQGTESEHTEEFLDTPHRFNVNESMGLEIVVQTEGAE